MEEVVKEKHKAPPPDIRRFLHPTGISETQYVRKLSSLCAQCYYLDKLTVRYASITRNRQFLEAFLRLLQ